MKENLITIGDIAFGKKILRPRQKTLDFSFTHDVKDDLYCAEDPDRTGVNTFSNSLVGLEDSIKEDIAFIYRIYGLGDANEMTQGAKDLKQKILDCFELI